MKRLTIIFVVIITVFALCLPSVQAKSIEKSRIRTDYNISLADRELIARVVYGEARGEPFLGKVAVANVVINRYESGLFGKTIRIVVRKPHQFALARRTNQECRNAVNYLLDNNLHLLPVNTYYFKRSPKRWRAFTTYCRIEHHSFFTQGIPVIDKSRPYIDEHGVLIIPQIETQVSLIASYG